MKALQSKLSQALLGIVLLTGATTHLFGQQADRYTLHLVNTSGFDIYRIQMSSSDDRSWHGDLLGTSGVLESGNAFDITNIVAGEYDLKLVDEDGDTCVKMKVQFFQNKVVNITRDWLIGCEFHNPGR
jgi:hypothetical protein